MAKETPESVVLRFIDCINRGGCHGITALTAPAYTLVDMEGDVPSFEGEDSIRASWDEYLSAYTEYRILVQSVLRSGDGVAIVGQTEESHLSPDIERDEVVLWIAEIIDGLIATWRIYSTLMCQGIAES